VVSLPRGPPSACVGDTCCIFTRLSPQVCASPTSLWRAEYPIALLVGGGGGGGGLGWVGGGGLGFVLGGGGGGVGGIKTFGRADDLRSCDIGSGRAYDSPSGAFYPASTVVLFFQRNAALRRCFLISTWHGAVSFFFLSFSFFSPLGGVCVF